MCKTPSTSHGALSFVLGTGITLTAGENTPGGQRSHLGDATRRSSPGDLPTMRHHQPALVNTNPVDTNSYGNTGHTEMAAAGLF